eukprot:gene13198-14486_t
MKFTVLCLILSIAAIFLRAKGQCSQNFAKKNQQMIDVYWVNLNSSVERRLDMEKYFEFAGITNHNRIPAFTPEDIEIPRGLGRSINCNFLHHLALKRRVRKLKSETSSHDAITKSQRVLLTGHCGRPKNNPKELSVALSHLLAMDRAINNPFSYTKYALIMEDDLHFAFDIDFEGLIASAPKDFAVLQLAISDQKTMYTVFKHFLQHQRQWLLRSEHPRAWCAGAYIINKEKLKPIIASLLQPQGNDLFLANIMALDPPKRNSSLSCWNHNRETPDLPCILSPHGYEADLFIYSFFPNQTYLLTTPIVTATQFALNSTIHQNHVNTDMKAFIEMQNVMTYQLLPTYYNEENKSSKDFLGHKFVHLSILPFLKDDCIRKCNERTSLCRQEMLENVIKYKGVVNYLQNEINITSIV